jgi:hypothetical protein
VYKSSNVNGLTGQDNHCQTAKNCNLIRFADVLLMAAEAEVELNDLQRVWEYVNRVWARAANPAGFVQGAPANYVINLYTAPFTDQAMAREAVRFERRLELAMEGHRFFDLVRWGIAAETLNPYLNMKKDRRNYLKTSAGFTKGKNEHYSIPNHIIEIARKAGNTLEQNPGY